MAKKTVSPAIGDIVPVGGVDGVLVALDPIEGSDQVVLRVCLNHDAHQHEDEDGQMVDSLADCSQAPGVRHALLLVHELQAG